MLIEQIVYTSDAAAAWHADELLGLLMQSSAANENQNITGLLLFEHGLFAQCIEGPQRAIEPLWHKIQKDQRHKSVVLLRRQTAALRWFPDWRMGLASDVAQALQIDGWCPPVKGQLLEARSSSAVINLFEKLGQQYAKARSFSHLSH